MSGNKIIIYCDNVSPKHGKKHSKPLVHVFRYDENHRDGTGQGWVDDNSHSKRLRNRNDHPYQLLVGDEKFDPAKFTIQNRDEWSGNLRESWILDCDKCGYAVRIVAANLFPALHRLRGFGVDRIGLQTLEDGLFHRSH